MKPCTHKFVFVRQEERLVGGSYRPSTDVFDVFYCEKCLTYEKKLVADIQPNGFDSGYTRRSRI